MIRLLHTADLHLDAALPELGPREEERRKDLLLGFERLVNLAIKNEVDLFLVAGDLFDSPRPLEEAVARVAEGFRRLGDRGILPVVVPGCRDGLGLPDAIFHRGRLGPVMLLARSGEAEPARIRIRGEEVFLYGGPWKPGGGSPLAPLTRSRGEGVHIGLLHAGGRGEQPTGDRWQDDGITAEEVRACGLDYLALGHRHDFATLGDGERVIACWPGSPEGLRFSEAGPRFCALVEVGAGEVRMEKILVNGRALEKRKVAVEDWENLSDGVAEVGALGSEDLLLRVTLTGVPGFPIDPVRLHAECAEEFFHLEVLDETDLFGSPALDAMAEEETLRGALVRRARILHEGAPLEDRPLLREALREVLVRLAAGGETAP